MSKKKADLDGAISILEEKSRAQNYIEKLAGKPGKKQMKYNYKSENTMHGQEECKNMLCLGKVALKQELRDISY